MILILHAQRKYFFMAEACYLNMIMRLLDSFRLILVHFFILSFIYVLPGLLSPIHLVFFFSCRSFSPPWSPFQTMHSVYSSRMAATSNQIKLKSKSIFLLFQKEHHSFGSSLIYTLNASQKTSSSWLPL